MATEKTMSPKDADQSIRTSFNDLDASLAISSFLVGQVGRKIDVSYPDTVTEVYNFSENGDALYELTIVYTDATKASLESAERTA